MALQDLFARAAASSPAAVAVRSPGGNATYGELDALANRVAHALAAAGVRAGDRVGLWLDKSPLGIAIMQGTLRLGAAYVPIDPYSPPARARKIIEDCGMRALVTTAARAGAIVQGSLASLPYLTVDADAEPGAVVGVPADVPPDATRPTKPVMTWAEVERLSAEPPPPHASKDHELAYILYTSGSTGTPKGVCISHLNALAFIEWAAEVVEPSPQDRFANHAPFHFDLSVLDLYVAFFGGASVCIIPEGVAYSATGLVDFIRRERPTVWYSVPSALILMMDHGAFLEVDDLPIRTLLFAGEPFPIPHLRRLYERWPGVRFMNLYGPTETNVCTYFEVTGSLEGRTRPVPIGRACSGDEVWAEKADGTKAAVGEEGELLVTGPTVMLGYFGKPPHGEVPYRTGDLVRLEENGDYVYLGRRDHMVKVRGFRVELGEIEAALLQHADLREVAVIAHETAGAVRLIAFVVGVADAPPASLLALKQHCADRLPRYMIVDRVRYVASLPRTGNGKVDRKKLESELEAKPA
jgi:amino acid adenylation domain-containing protein